MLELTWMNSGVRWYLLNSSTQACCPMGGTAPLIGFHSTIESPERVSRVKPPHSTRKATKRAKTKSHVITALSLVLGMLAPFSESPAIIAPQKKFPPRREFGFANFCPAGSAPAA